MNFQNDLSRLWNWNIANLMIANVDKTKCLAIKRQPILFLGLTAPLANMTLHKDWICILRMILNGSVMLKFNSTKGEDPFMLGSPKSLSIPFRVQNYISIVQWCSPSLFMVFLLGLPTLQD